MNLRNLVLCGGLALVAAQGLNCGTGITIELPDGGQIIIPGATVVVVEVFNDTGFEVEPRIYFDEDANWFASLFPSEELATGTLAPGDLVRFNFACDRLGLIVSRLAGQFLPGDDVPIGQAASTRVLRRDRDYDCGDTIGFHFVGSGASFGVVVSVNDRVVD